MLFGWTSTTKNVILRFLKNTKLHEEEIQVEDFFAAPHCG